MSRPHRAGHSRCSRGSRPLTESTKYSATSKRCIATEGTAADAPSRPCSRLAAVGLYGVIAYNVTQRTHEIGVRIALGARAADVLWLVVRQGIVLGVVGIAIGTTVTLGAAGHVSTFLFGVSARDPIIYACVVISILVVAVTASFVPAHRAACIDPNIALRSE